MPVQFADSTFDPAAGRRRRPSRRHCGGKSGHGAGRMLDPVTARPEYQCNGRMPMNVAESASAKLRPDAVDFERFRLRRFIESLAADELDSCEAAIDLAGLAGVMEGNPKAVLFRS